MARNNIVLADNDGGLDWFDYREVAQILFSIAIVGCTLMGAFMLSYYTPVSHHHPVGLAIYPLRS